MPPKVEMHTHLPDSIVAILVGLVILIFDWFGGVPILGWGWAIIVGIIGFALIVIGFLKLLFA